MAVAYELWHIFYNGNVAIKYQRLDLLYAYYLYSKQLPNDLYYSVHGHVYPRVCLQLARVHLWVAYHFYTTLSSKLKLSDILW